jgi:hypothetical protein
MGERRPFMFFTSKLVERYCLKTPNQMEFGARGRDFYYQTTVDSKWNWLFELKA